MGQQEVNMYPDLAPRPPEDDEEKDEEEGENE